MESSSMGYEEEQVVRAFKLKPKALIFKRIFI